MIGALRHPVEDDHGRVMAVMDEWWGGLGGEAGSLYRATLLPRLYFQHFTDTSYVLDLPGKDLGAFLVGFVSQSEPGTGYIHFVGVAPALRRTGVGGALYRRFFTDVAARGVRKVHSITGVGNRRSVAFHTRLGFTLEPGDAEVDGLPVHRNYDGPGRDSVKFVKHLP
ncbi:GNAT family N-acetyltransferase [Dactylosporangium sp. NBC_01737]|uniref:GNAT family N-acetyltransferase n=1 Tax=Dactylosporangium sp. NBC_01737 TaxID=2975959 RepID=UPI002E0F8FA7|nr:GNAT family N-acetyltransferase [Dactylosporangium sp. NBC_01737]